MTPDGLFRVKTLWVCQPQGSKPYLRGQNIKQKGRFTCLHKAKISSIFIIFCPYLCITKQREKCQALDRRLSHFPCCAEGPSCETEGIPGKTKVMSKKITTTTPPTAYINKEQGWNKNTDLGCDVKTILRSDKRMKVGKDYQGVLRHDSEAIVDEFISRDSHYTFVETLSWSTKRNPRLFNGKFISVTRRDDGSLRPNFKPMRVDKDFTVDGYALGVCNELRMALKGLVEE